jgi:hypothetical protein
MQGFEGESTLLQDLAHPFHSMLSFVSGSTMIQSATLCFNPFMNQSMLQSMFQSIHGSKRHTLFQSIHDSIHNSIHVSIHVSIYS